MEGETIDPLSLKTRRKIAEAVLSGFNIESVWFWCLDLPSYEEGGIFDSMPRMPY